MLTPTVAWALFVDLPTACCTPPACPTARRSSRRSWEREWIEDKPRDAQTLDDESPLAKGLFDTRSYIRCSVLQRHGRGVWLPVQRVGLRRERRSATSDRGLRAGARDVETNEKPGVGNLRAAREEWALGASVDANEFVCEGTDLRPLDRRAAVGALSVRLALGTP